jgi:hypothetical protein
MKAKVEEDLIATNTETSYRCNKKTTTTKRKMGKRRKRIEKLVGTRHEKPVASDKQRLHGFCS